MRHPKHRIGAILLAFFLAFSPAGNLTLPMAKVATPAPAQEQGLLKPPGTRSALAVTPAPEPVQLPVISVSPETGSGIEVAATRETAKGVDPNSGFSVNLPVAVEEGQLREMITVSPHTPFRLEGEGTLWTVQPTEAMTLDSVYRLEFRDANGLVDSFAFQIHTGLLVQSFYPDPGWKQTVPINTGIEFTFNRDNVDISRHFTISPQVPGHFKIEGNTSVFVPDRLLQPGTEYAVMLRAGLTAPDGAALDSETPYKFTTESSPNDRPVPMLYLSNRMPFFQTLISEDPVTMDLNVSDDIKDGEFDVTVHRYPDDKAFLSALEYWNTYYKMHYDAPVLETEGLTEAAAFTAPLSEGGSVTVPNRLPEGYYVMTVSRREETGLLLVQSLIQVNSLTLYVQQQQNKALFWINDSADGKAAAGLEFLATNSKGATVRGKTDKNGLLVLKGANATDPNTITIRRKGKTPFLYDLSGAYVGEKSLEQRYYSMLYTDREIYQPTDTVRFWGAVRPRSKQDTLPKTLEATVSGLHRVTVQVRSDGTFQGEIPISMLWAGWYDLSIWTDGDERSPLISRYLQVYEFQKPAFTLDVQVEGDRDFYYTDEPYTLAVTGAYYDGTPLANGKIMLDNQELTLDGSGKARYTVQPPSWTTGQRPTYASHTAYSMELEDLNLRTSIYVKVVPSRTLAWIEWKDPSVFTLRTVRLDPAKLAAFDWQSYFNNEKLAEALGGGPADIPVKVTFKRTLYTRVPIESEYDPVNNVMIPRYRLEKSGESELPYEAQTKNGVLRLTGLPFTKSALEWDQVTVEFAGAGQTVQLMEMYREEPKSNDWISWEERQAQWDKLVHPYRLEAPKTENLRIGERVALEIKRDGKTPKAGRALCNFVRAGGVETRLIGQSHSYRYTTADVPNMEVTGAYFDGKHVYVLSSLALSYDASQEELSVKITPDRDSYRPGDTAKISVRVKNVQGTPRAAEVCLGVVDEALFDIQEQELHLRENLYAPLQLGLTQKVSTVFPPGEGKTPANTGGGGGGESYMATVRQDFADTALFRTVTLDASGSGTVELTIPDNMTSWRITAAAYYNGNPPEAGSAVTNVIATLPFYLRPLYPETYLEGDDVALALRCVGTGIDPQDAASYTVTLTGENTAPLRREAGGPAGDLAQINFGKLPAGTYVWEARAQCGDYADAMRIECAVVKSSLIVKASQILPLEELNGFSSLRYPVSITVYDGRYKPYMEALQTLMWQSGNRTEVLAASYLAEKAYVQLLEPENRYSVKLDERLRDVLDAEGVAPLPLARPAPETTAKMLWAAPEMLAGTRQSQRFLEEALNDPAYTTGDRVQTYLGLAACGSPVLREIAALLEDGSLPPDQRLTLGAALARLGDFEAARAVYFQYAPDFLRRDDTLCFVSDDPETQRRTTAAALLLASELSLPDGEGLMLWLCRNRRPYGDGNVYNLEILSYVNHFTPPKETGNAAFSYFDGQTRQRVELKNHGRATLFLGYEQLRDAAFRVERGQLNALVHFAAIGEQLPLWDSGITMEKSYEPALDGAVWNVTLTIHLPADAPSGTYLITDRIPSGMLWIPMQAVGVESTDRNAGYPYWADCQGQNLRLYLHRYVSTREDTPPVPDTVTIRYQVMNPIKGSFVGESAALAMPGHSGLAARSPRVPPPEK